MRLVRKFLTTALAAVVATGVGLPAMAQSTSQTLGSESVIETIKSAASSKSAYRCLFLGQCVT